MDRREEIIAVAQDLIAQRGFQKTTMELIAQTIGMGKSSLYYYFSKKDDIFAEIIRRDSYQFKQELQQAVAGEESLKAKVQAFMVARIRHLVQLAELYSTLVDEYLDLYSFVEEIRDEFWLFQVDTIISLLKRGKEAGECVVDNSETAAILILTVIKGMEYRLLRGTPAHELYNEAAEMTEMLFTGIRS